MTDRSTLATGFIATAGVQNATRVVIAGDASNRRYERLTTPDGQTTILMDASPDRGEDVQPFVRLSAYLTDQGISAPQILHEDAQNGFLLIEDLGDDLFARLMADDPARQEPLYRAATDLLWHLHQAPPLALDTCDADWLTDMTGPFFEYYTPDADARAFGHIFRPLATQLDTTPKVTILRDFHAENLLWLPDRTGVAQVGVLDFQDALLGHPAYDLVSILQDARRDVSPHTEALMIAHYLARSGTDQDAFRFAYALLGAQRNLRILGIFARLCLRDGKAHYVDMIPRVWTYVMRNLKNPALAPVATALKGALAEPTPPFLEHLKSQCATAP